MTTETPSKNSAAGQGFILGVVTLMLTPIMPLIGLITAVFAVVLSRRGLAATQHLAGRGRDLAIVGLAIGILCFFISLALLLFPLVQPNIPFGS